jgi:hypothetical protein
MANEAVAVGGVFDGTRQVGERFLRHRKLVQAACVKHDVPWSFYLDMTQRVGMPGMDVDPLAYMNAVQTNSALAATMLASSIPPGSIFQLIQEILAAIPAFMSVCPKP